MFVSKSLSLPLTALDSVVCLSKQQYSLDNRLKIRMKQFLQRRRVLSRLTARKLTLKETGAETFQSPPLFRFYPRLALQCVSANIHSCQYIYISDSLFFPPPNGSGQVRTKFVPCSFHVRSLRNEQITKMGRIWKGRLVRIFPLHWVCSACALLQSGCSTAAVRLQ